MALLYRVFFQFSIWIPLNVPNILCGLHPHFVNYICIMWLIINMQLHRKLWFDNECKNVFMVCLCIVYGRTGCHCFDTSWHLLIISVYCSIQLFLWTKYWDITLHCKKNEWSGPATFQPNQTGELHAAGLKMNVLDSKQLATPFFPSKPGQ